MGSSFLKGEIQESVTLGVADLIRPKLGQNPSPNLVLDSGVSEDITIAEKLNKNSICEDSGKRKYHWMLEKLRSTFSKVKVAVQRG